MRNRINWFDSADFYGTGELKDRSEVRLGISMLKVQEHSLHQLYFLDINRDNPTHMFVQGLLHFPGQ
ncbi:hypothetical protein EON65_03300 [archaeon]|nr:MAG: hypothetical protein EON65_03300 [archaeon]